MTTIAGLDVGGSRTRLRIVEEGVTRAEVEVGSANPAAVGPDGAATELRAALAGVGEAAADVSAVCAGVAGADTTVARAACAQLLGALFPGARVLVVHDARLVLAAAGLDAGVALIAGTGSIAYARAPSGQEARAGGWGHRLGDEGGAYWVVREALRQELAAFDRGDSGGPALPVLLAAAGAANHLELLHLFHSTPEPARWAAAAAAVLETDPHLVQMAAEHLVAGARIAAERVAIDGPFVLAGGLLLGHAGLRRAVLGRLPEAVTLDLPPVAGAIHLAQELLESP